MEFLLGMVVGVFLSWWFNNPEKAKEIKEDVKSKIEQHKS